MPHHRLECRLGEVCSYTGRLRQRILEEFLGRPNLLRQTFLNNLWCPSGEKVDLGHGTASACVQVLISSL